MLGYFPSIFFGVLFLNFVSISNSDCSNLKKYSFIKQPFCSSSLLKKVFTKLLTLKNEKNEENSTAFSTYDNLSRL